MAAIRTPATGYGPAAATATATANTSEGEKKNINQELWQACAGPLVNLPAAGTHVVYFPQGHSEQVAASMKKDADGQIPNYPNLPSKLICLLHNVTLHADPETDEVYAQMMLQPVPTFDKEALLRSDLSMKTNRPQTEFFCKTLTASDTSTHGGFSVPRRAAEKIFHPLDFSLQPPAQELETRDLHDNVWRFRHIFRGQPKRHLLTTGWSLFVSGKRLFAGDSVLFIRDEKQHLLLGIRRANRQPTNLSSSVLSSDSMHIGILAAAAHAAAHNSPFTVFYNPRTSPSEFVIPLAKYYRAACSNQISLGMRFRMMFETEESGTRRYMGTITGITDLDPVRWKSSQWRNLQVGWDESTAGEKRNRVSIWEIEPVTAPFFICPTPFFQPKRPRQPGMLDDDSSDLDNVFKRTAMPWFGDDLGMMKDPHSNPGLSLMQWMNMQPNPSLANSIQPSYLNSLSGSVLQNFGGNSLQFNNNTIQKPLQQTHIDQIQKLPAVSSLNPLGSMINQVPAQMLQSQSQSLVQNPNILLQPQPPSISNHQLQRNLSSNFQPQQNFDPISQQLQMSDNQIQLQLLQKLQQQQQQVLLAQQQQSQLPQFHEHQSKQIQEPSQNFSRSVSTSSQMVEIPQSMSKSDNSHQNVLFSNPPPQQQKQIPAPITNVTGFPCHFPAGSSLLTGAVGGGQSVITDDVPSCSTSPSTNNCPDNRIQQQTTHSSATLFGSSGWETISANNSSVKDVKQKPDIKISTNIMNQGFLAPSTYTNATNAGGQIDYLDSSSATSVCLSQNDLQLQQNNATIAYNNNTAQTMLFRDASQDEEALAVGFETNIETQMGMQTQMGMPMIPDPLLAKTIVGSSSKDFFNNLSNYEGAKDLQQELSSSMVSQSFGVPDMGGFNSLDSSINGSSFLNGGSWVPQPQLPRMRTYTKVYKRGAVGRSIDIGRYSGYEELKHDLARRFGIEGQLEDRHRVGWKVVYVDHENEVLLVGDDPWEEFVNCVRCIKILSPQEVQKMSLDGDFGNNVLPNPAGSSSDGCNQSINQMFPGNF